MNIANRKNSIKKELKKKYLVTRVLGLNVYIVDASNAPQTMLEIGRIREFEFRSEGGGTAHSLDIDSYDRDAPRYRQLLAWDPLEEEIVAMYRFFRGVDAYEHRVDLASAELFEFSPLFLKDYLPCTIELGRSVVNRSARRAYKGLFVIWMGLGTLIREYSDTRYFLGKFTVSPKLSIQLRSLMYSMLNYWRGGNALISPRPEYRVTYNDPVWEPGENFKDDLSRLIDYASSCGEVLPPLVLSYARLSDNIQLFGTALNASFGNVEETAILVPIGDIHPRIRETFIDSYTSTNPEAFF